MKRNIALIVFGLACTVMFAQAFLVFDFENHDMIPSQGTGTMSLVGGVSLPASDAWPGGYAPTPSVAMNTTNYPAQGVANTGSGVQVMASTAGKSNIQITWHNRCSNTGANRTRLQYTTDGSTWVNFEANASNASNMDGTNDQGFDEGLYITSGTYAHARMADFSSIPTANNNANFGVRFITAFPSGTNAYGAATSTSGYATTGMVRFDNVTFLSSDSNTVATPTASPTGGTFDNPVNVTLFCATEGSSIRYTIDNTNPSPTLGTVYEAPINISTPTTLKFIAYIEGMTPSAVITQVYGFNLPPQDVENIAALKAITPGTSTVYTITNPVIVSYKHTWRNQIFVQDSTAGLLIDDYPDIITTNYNIGDAITGLKGTTQVFTTTGQFQLVPTADPGPASSTGNVLEPIIITANQLNETYDAYDARLVTLNNVHFVEPTGNFANNQTYPMAQGATAFNFFTTFQSSSSDVDYIGSAIPTGLINLTGLPTHRAIGAVIAARYLSDMNPSSETDVTVTPKSNKLVGNYPNPFNPSTTIAFELAKPSHVNITIYNVKGQKVKELFNGEMPAGSHNIVWNGEETSSGIYFYKMTTNQGAQVKRAILLK